MTDAKPTPDPTDVSRETHEMLQDYLGLLGKWNKTINLVAASTMPNAWERHILDSWQVYPLASASWTSWMDVGSGGGLPGIVVAILAHADNARHITLVESDTRKSTFLRTVKRELGLSCDILNDRIEYIAPQNVDVITARAFAPLSKLLNQVAPHVSPQTQLILLKGQAADDEIKQAQAIWSFDVTAKPSITDPNASLLIIRDLSRA